MQMSRGEPSSFIKTKTAKVVGLFLAGTVAISGTYAWFQSQEDKKDEQNQPNGTTGNGGGSYYHSYGTSSYGGSTEKPAGGSISTGTATKGGIGSSAVGGGE